MIADITSVEIALPVSGDYGAALGAARLGAIASGRQADEILQKPAIESVFKPAKAHHALYQARYQKWQNLYQAIAAL